MAENTPPKYQLHDFQRLITLGNNQYINIYLFQKKKKKKKKKLFIFNTISNQY